MNPHEFMIQWRKEKGIPQAPMMWPIGLWHECMEAYHRAKVEEQLGKEDEFEKEINDVADEAFDCDNNHKDERYFRAEAFVNGGRHIRNKLLNQ